MKEHVKETVPFFKTVWLALNPWRYDEVKDKGTGKVFKYFFSFVFLAFVLAVLLMLPTIGSFAYNQLSHFDVLEVKFNTSMNSPVVFPEHRPYVTLDTRTSEGKLKEGKYLITEDYLYRKATFSSKVHREPLRPYKNLLENEWAVVLLLLLMLPSLLFLFYIGYAIKVLLVVLLATVLGFVIARIIKFEIMFKDLLKAGLLAATPMIIIDLIRMPFALNVYFAQYIAFLVFFIVGMIKAGDFEGSGRSRRKKKHKFKM
jgi:hypothetical protein